MTFTDKPWTGKENPVNVHDLCRNLMDGVEASELLVTEIGVEVIEKELRGYGFRLVKSGDIYRSVSYRN